MQKREIQRHIQEGLQREKRQQGEQEIQEERTKNVT